jgi:hypothetical protein
MTYKIELMSLDVLDNWERCVLEYDSLLEAIESVTRFDYASGYIKSVYIVTPTGNRVPVFTDGNVPLFNGVKDNV